MSGWRRRHRPDHEPREVEHDIDEELAFHLAATAEDLQSRGMSEVDARRTAASRFGSLRRHRRDLVRLEKRALAHMRRRAMVGVFVMSVRATWRGIGNRPAFAAAVIVILALGLGVNAVTFHLVDRLLLSGPSGVEEPDRVYRVVVYHRSPGESELADTNYSYLDYRDLLSVRSISVAAGETSSPQLLGSGDSAQLIQARLVTASYFPMLGVSPALGRFFTTAESEREAARVVVLGYNLWQRRFNRDPAVIGQTLQIGVGRYLVIGVAPRNFTGSYVTRTDVFLPLEAAADEQVSGDWQTSRGLGWMAGIVRLAPGVSATAAAAEATAVHQAAHAEERTEHSQGRYEFVPMNAVRGVTAAGDTSVAGLAAAVALLVLVIAIANVANLFMARALRRASEQAVRMAMGSGRARMIAEQAVEGAMLALLGATVAAVVAVYGNRLAQRFLFPSVEWPETAIDFRGVLFVGIAAVIGGALAAGLPAWMTSRADVAHSLRSTGSRIVARRTRTQIMMLVVQGALSVLLLVGAGLFVRSLAALQQLDLGIDSERLLSVGLAPGERPLPTDLRQKLQERISRISGVERTTIVTGTMPFVSSWATRLNIPGLPNRPTVASGGPYVNAVDPDYFRTMGTSVIEGRPFNESDRVGAPLVAIVNASMARLYWPGESALGKCLQVGINDPPCSTVVGVVENTRRNAVVEGENLLYYLPLPQAPGTVLFAGTRILVRTADDDEAAKAAIAERIRREALTLEPGLRYVGVQPLSDVIAPQLRSWRLGAALFGGFGLLALVVAAVGLYSVIAFDVQGRQREIGLRAALGAPAAAIARSLVATGIKIAAVGIAIGLAGAWLLAPPLMADLLYGVSPRDGGVFVTVTVVLVLSSIAATLLPARRAARIDPVVALRDE